MSGKLTLLQRKLSNVLLLNAYDTLMSRPSHQIDARTLCLMIGYNSNDMDTLKQSLRGLAETVAEWDMQRPGKGYPWPIQCAKGTRFRDGREGFCAPTGIDKAGFNPKNPSPAKRALSYRNRMPLALQTGALHPENGFRTTFI